MLALVALSALVAGALTGRSADEHAATGKRAPAPKAADALTLPQQVGELVLMRFDGLRPPAYVRRVLRERRAAGVTLFEENVRDRAQVRALTHELQAAAGNRLLIAADQEGGIARRLPWSTAVGQPSQPTEHASDAYAGATADALRAAGVNLNFAPVLDLGIGPAMAARTYPGDSAQVGRLGATAVRAHHTRGVAATVKHFPGFGRATANTDDAPVTIGASRAELEDDLAPFRAAIAAGAPAVMVSHALYPAYDSAHIATQSSAIVTGLLRGRLGFRGVVATDSMEADAVLKRSSMPTAAVRSIAAGCDLLVLTGRGSWRLVYARLLAEARRSPAFRSRVAESARRVLALKRSLGLPISGAQVRG
ncbi:MAG: beta-N-acetylhexosaminidase [Thermoleophilaceae bacterium]|nr:beta-N-acetylhexosaminidase [Thermoleophilaceae bacterium]